MKALILAILLTDTADLATTCIGFKHGMVEGYGPAKFVGNSCAKATAVSIAGTISKIYIVKKLDKVGKKKLAKFVAISFSVSSTHAAVMNTIKIGKK